MYKRKYKFHVPNEIMNRVSHVKKGQLYPPVSFHKTSVVTSISLFNVIHSQLMFTVHTRDVILPAVVRNVKAVFQPMSARAWSTDVNIETSTSAQTGDSDVRQRFLEFDRFN